MGLRQLTGLGRSAPQPNEKTEESAPTSDRCLTLMVEGAALNMPEIDPETYKAFRASASGMAIQVPDRLPSADKLAQIQKILREFETYRNGAEAALKERQNGWRALTATLLRELFGSLGIDAGTGEAASLTQKIAGLVTAAEIQAYRVQLSDFLHPHGDDGSAVEVSPLQVADHSMENDNAAGLRGGGSAVEHVKRILENGRRGFVVLFRLGCLEMISQRFGPEAVEDCLMAVAAFLTASLHRDDAIYHWSDCLLLAVIEGRSSEQILTAELGRIALQNREVTISIGGRNIMLRVPLDFEINSIRSLNAAEDLYKLSMQHEAMW
jgi:hypothetical protein